MPEGARTTPSVVAFTKDGERLVGQVAKRQAVTNPDRTVISIKREMGTDHKVTIDGKDYTPPEISAMILQKLKSRRGSLSGRDRLRRPSSPFRPISPTAQRQATKDAGAASPVWKFCVSSTSLPLRALAYGLGQE